MSVKPVINGVAQPIAYSYDGAGNLTTVQAPDGRTRTLSYDAALRMVREYEPEPGGTFAVKRYGYNSNSQVTGVSIERASAIIDPPASAPTVSAPATNTSGTYSVSWTAVAGAATYRLEQSIQGGAWTLIQQDGSLNRAMSSQAVGSYGYRVNACNQAGCGPLSSVATVQVQPPPALTYAAELVSLESSNGWALASGDRTVITWTFRNVGTATWDGSVYLGNNKPTSYSAPPHTGLPLPSSVAPGAVATFTSEFNAPQLEADMKLFQVGGQLARSGPIWFGPEAKATLQVEDLDGYCTREPGQAEICHEPR